MVDESLSVQQAEAEKEGAVVAAAEEVKDENSNQGMEMESVGTFGNKESEFWDRIGEADFQQLMMMMDFAGDSSDSGAGNNFTS